MARKIPTEDPWIYANSYVFSVRRLHALGVMTVNWNACEGRLLELFGVVSGLTGRAKWVVTKDQGNATLLEMVRQFAAANLSDKDEREEVVYACKLFDACRVNRNHLVHFALTNNARAFLMKRRSKTAPELTQTNHSVPVIRRNADTFREAQSYLLNLAVVLQTRKIRPDVLFPDRPSLPASLVPPVPHTPKRQPLRPQLSPK